MTRMVTNYDKEAEAEARQAELGNGNTEYVVYGKLQQELAKDLWCETPEEAVNRVMGKLVGIDLRRVTELKKVRDIDGWDFKVKDVRSMFCHYYIAFADFKDTVLEEIK